MQKLGYLLILKKLIVVKTNLFLPGGVTTNVKETDLSHPANFQRSLQPEE